MTSATPLLDAATIARVTLDDLDLTTTEEDTLRYDKQARNQLSDLLVDLIHRERLPQLALDLWREERSER